MAPSQPSNAASTSVQVALRIRPTNQHDLSTIPSRFQRNVINAASNTTVSVDSTPSTGPGAPAPTSSSANSAKKQTFTFDQVHPPATTQHAMFTSTALPLISRFVEGFNCTILAYGQTSSGKTFTMTGIDLDADPTDASNGMGIIPRAVSTIFARCREMKEERSGAWTYQLKGSYIEIYNEDLIDLLADTGGKRDVQIREDKQGHIIWEGLREVNVKSANEVMSLIRQGASIRRTNETDMNAQSSRSHAIFSLTLIQRKFVGSGPPPRSSSPLPPGGRSPSRIGRPGSVIGTSSNGRVSSPTFGRPATPSFQSAIARGTRPASSLGFLSPEMPKKDSGGESGSGEWVTVTSKFHFVDLAGSERLKRTAAAGERIKEGISINSGLLALGNVISALGDPAKAKTNTASYIPYRDSKLTRLLQDSLGGNAHTLMIACVSPAEWNANETINTLKYANRARNIKNRAVLNEREEGWDDVEWLQGMVTRLRKEVKQIKEGGGVGATVISSGPSEASEGSSKRVLAQMTELQNNYEDLREKFVERTEELTRLRNELAEKQRNSTGGRLGGTAKYEEIVGPVIEEYEKTISAMEAELKLNRAALRHTNDLYDEKENEYNTLADRHSTTEMYLEELKARVVKLAEREASTEAYVHDLEEKVRLYDESSTSSSGSITDLKRELAKYKDSESHSAEYIADLEARLSKSDESVLALRATVEVLERECEKRRNQVTALESRLESLKQDGESWRSDLELREARVQELETKMADWEVKMQAANEERERLNELASEVAKAKKQLEASPVKTNGATTNGTTSTGANSEVSSIHEADGLVDSQLVALQQTHTATLADLSSVTAKYRDALREIADLAAQLQEAKVNAPPPPPESPERGGDISPGRRRMQRSRDQESSSGSGRRLFFRNAVSSESLHSRSLSQSVSLSQELSSARSRKASISSHGTSSSISSTSRPNLSISLPSVTISPTERSVASLEEEIMRLQDVIKEREVEITVLESTLKEKTTPPGTPHIMTNGLKDPVPYTNGDATLHLSPKTMSQFTEIRKSLDLRPSTDLTDSDVDESLVRLNELMRSMAQKESVHKEVVDDLTNQLSSIRKQHEDLQVLSRDQALNMSMELDALRQRHDDLVAAQGEQGEAEARHLELTESLEGSQAQHAALQASLDDLTKREAELIQSLKQAEDTHSADVEQLKAAHEEAIHVKSEEHDALVVKLKEEHETSLGELRTQLAQSASVLEMAQRDHEQVFGKLKAEHEEELRCRLDEAAELLERTRADHEAALTKAVSDHDGALTAMKTIEERNSLHLSRIEEEYYDALTKLRTDHAQALERQAAESATALERLKDEHTRDVRMAEIAQQGSLSESETSRDEALKSLQEEHASAIKNKEQQFAADIHRLKEEHAAALTAKLDQHRESLQRVKADHSSTLAAKELEFADRIDRIEAEHVRVLAEKEKAALSANERLVEEHAGVTAKLKEESTQEIARLTGALEEARSERAAAEAGLKKEMEEMSKSSDEKHSAALADLKRAHAEELERLAESHKDALSSSSSTSEEQRSTLVKEHTEEVVRLKAEHQTALTEAQNALVAATEQHRSELEASRSQSNLLMTAEKEQLEATLAEVDKTHSEERDTLLRKHDLLLEDLRKKHAEELETLSKEHNTLLDELDTHKAASDEWAHAREEMRQAHESVIQQKNENITSLQTELSTARSERDSFSAELEKLRSELLSTREETSALVKEASKRQSLVDELEKHRFVIAEMQENLQKTKDEMDNLMAEKNRQDALLRDLQQQLGSPTPSARPTMDRNVSYSRATGIMSPGKLPPPTPPPTVPIPPAPRAIHEQHSSSSSTAMSSRSISVDGMESPSTPATSISHSIANGLPSPLVGPRDPDPKLTAQVQQQAKQLDEQEAMIKTLNKQLTHCEGDLQAHMDMVATLEASLGDSEKNLRKARMQATELARERDNLSNQIVSLRTDLAEAKAEVVNVRRSVVEEKQSLESRLDEERRAKERARAQLDTRMEELQRRKSKFACL
ncbi:kinesin-domain-containing protein [Epithele typhae]|uniref:kinesin-domain-containing protein n=1 Tax=Epithele typhae TaxID=378194 RepID=UPI002007CB19|nr:kinesin-domain-containing protein [Epithele typhae]KAH9945823.1 kinesin-domain-containing protein [Epithele typhae]